MGQSKHRNIAASVNQKRVLCGSPSYLVVFVFVIVLLVLVVTIFELSETKPYSSISQQQATIASKQQSNVVTTPSRKFSFLKLDGIPKVESQSEHIVRVCIVGGVSKKLEEDSMIDLANYLSTSNNFDVTLLLPYDNDTNTIKLSTGLRVGCSMCVSNVTHPTIKDISYHHYLYLKNVSFNNKLPYDVVFFPLISGLGFFTLGAKKQGQSWLDLTSVIIVADTPSSDWIRMIGQIPLTSLEIIDYFYMEKKSVELSDIFLSNSENTLTWMSSNGWMLPEKSYFHPTFVSPLRYVFSSPSSNPTARIAELVFIGPLETRYAFQMFVDSLLILITGAKNKLSDFPGVPTNLMVTLVGGYSKDINVDGFSASEYLSLQMPPNLQKIQYINSAPKSYFLEKELTRLAIFLSPYPYYYSVASEYVLENANAPLSPFISSSVSIMDCLCSGIPLIVANMSVSGMLEQENFWSKIVFSPSERGLAAKLAKVFQSGFETGGILPAKMSIDLKTHANTFANWIYYVGNNTVPPNRISDGWSTSIILTYRKNEIFLVKQLHAVINGILGMMPVAEIILVYRGPFKSPRDFLHDNLVYEVANSGVLKLYNIGYPQTVAQARHFGAMKSEGKFLLFIEENVLPIPNAMQIIQQIHSETHADIISSKLSVNNSIENHYLGGPPSLISIKNVLGGGSFLVRRDVYENVGGLIDNHEPIQSVEWKFFAQALVLGYRIEISVDPLFYVPLPSPQDKYVLEPRTPLHHSFVLNDADLWDKVTLQDTSFHHLISYTHYLHSTHMSKNKKEYP